ncbi:HAMP domain-containing histidine kinase [Clostridium beijerinckii]|uniref:HAMP domain-containing histidine kinase n=1 Tax=Clostridium beijerinckii TaxID=1520 RepID=UPI00149454AE|nr:HAMP domain-containing histidine kinase [Clostridium beijerinckii]NOW04930.1 hypothetical protein [Clostridium beijerinckii]NRT35960.1 hypothetical protein [Clostridium beijerinckii]NRT44613.1 hypothetical protein [Clostridium beijerinckii]NRZ21395.1 hypothetical protein [Clostridium beijerinckii]NYC01928.1 hypothetical protein [Clostridium beijerinckii]
MLFNEKVYDIIIICNLKGVIVDVIKNELGLVVFPICGQSIINSVDDASKSKIIRFLYEVIDMHEVSNWEINLKIRKQLEPVSISGEYIDNNHICIGIASKPEVLNYYEEIMAINSEQLNEIRRLSKQKSSEEARVFEKRADELEKILLFDVGTRINYLSKYIECLNDVEKYSKAEIINSMKNLFDDIVNEIYKATNEEKIEGIKLNVMRNKVGIKDLLEYIVNIEHEFFEELNIKVEMNRHEILHPIYVYGDEDKLKLVLNNLFLCLIQHCKHNTKFKINFKLVEDNVLLMLKFKPTNLFKNIGKLIEYRLVRKVIETSSGSMWVEERNDDTVIYIGMKMHVC